MTFDIDSDDKVVKVSKKAYIVISTIYRSIFFFVGVWLGTILYKECLLDPQANT